MKQAVLIDDHRIAHEVVDRTLDTLRVRCFSGRLPWRGIARVPPNDMPGVHGEAMAR